MTGDPVRLLWTLVALLLWLALVAAVAWREARARRRSAPRASPRAEGETVLVAFASQTGFGEELAVMTAETLRRGGSAVRMTPLDQVDTETLRTCGRALLIVSTTGEGDPPDNAARFVRRVMTDEADLSGVRYGLLALGDRDYDQFCGFGHAVDGWLRRAGAEPLYDLVEVDNGDAGAIRHWQHQLNALTGAVDEPDWTPPAYLPWRLTHRMLLNPGSPGGEAYHLRLEPIDHAPEWRAGDIAEVGVPASDAHPAPGAREYSVASLPADGGVEFVIRLARHADGTPGLASGWLTQDCPLGGEVAMRLRANSGFHGPARKTPMILIGNGTGLAGLRAHIKERPTGCETWLLFGERTRAHDAFFEDELRGCLATGFLTRLDRCFSRDEGDGRYVQDLIAANADEMRVWIARGAAVYVCGSLEGMSRGVHAALETMLGEEAVIQLIEDGRYRRDVY
ncbi:sulfite reductase subunit alpha [Brevundimonas sp. PAMC22021]|uniref:sulfite reductase subunit alpha n=1 Tax=Brevundimonas sp. PAMC22021 TaxID=2861285 RepID=UPI001C63A2E0|nr:sulfite reductase subunit alpha [Brevundimonas sp. PAMC22021]QYF86089.1 sulfite reductase subunit alpha [Brevundimonas sp. PAMC22021]